MKKTVLLIAVIFVFFGCKKEEVIEFPFDSFIFSYSALHHDNSIKFTKSDTVYFQKRFPEPKENFYALLKSDQKATINKFFKNVNLEKFNSNYEDDVTDGGNLIFNVLKDKKSKSVEIYGGNAPKELYNYASFLIEFKNELKFIKTKKSIFSGNQRSTFDRPPPPPPPPLKSK